MSYNEPQIASLEWSTLVPEHHHADEVAVEHLAQFTHALRFVSHNHTANRHRYYLLSWQPTLEGSTVLVCTWGRCTHMAALAFFAPLPSQTFRT